MGATLVRELLLGTPRILHRTAKARGRCLDCVRLGGDLLAKTTCPAEVLLEGRERGRVPLRTQAGASVGVRLRWRRVDVLWRGSDLVDGRGLVRGLSRVGWDVGRGGEGRLDGRSGRVDRLEGIGRLAVVVDGVYALRERWDLDDGSRRGWRMM